MLNAMGGLVVHVEADRDITYADVESALNAEGFLSDYLIHRSALTGCTQLTISVHLPVSLITADGVPPFDAVAAMQSLTNALARLDAPRE